MLGPPRTRHEALSYPHATAQGESSKLHQSSLELEFKGADIDARALGPQDATLIGAPSQGRVARVQRRAVGKQGHGRRRSAIVLERAKPWVDPADISAYLVAGGAEAGRAVAG